MNAIVSFRKCTLSNWELVEKVNKLTDQMFTDRKIPSRNIPARPNDDYDLLVGELIVRFVELTKTDEGDSVKGDVVGQAVEAKPTVIFIKKESFKITTPDKSTRDVTGQSVSLSGYEGLDLFVHREGGKKGDFVLTEKRTGLEIGRGNTAKEAVDKAIYTLKWQQSYNKEYPSIYNQLNGHINGSSKYENIPIPEISNSEKIKILEEKIKEQQEERADEIKNASRFFSTANTDFQQKFIKRIEERIAELKNDK